MADNPIVGFTKDELTEMVRQILAEIPTSLPANGGNADTVDDYHVSEGIHSSTSTPPEYFTDVARIDHTSKMIESWDTGNIKVALADRATNAENADTVDGLHADDFIYPRAMLSDTDLNTILYPCSALIYGDCTNMPPVSSWGTLLCYSGGTGSHVQLWVTATNSSMFKRHYDGVRWSDWKEISTTPIKSTTFSANADGTGNFNLWASGENKVPISIQLDNNTFYAVPFLYANQLWLGSTINEVTRQPVADVTVSGTIFYFEL